MEKDMEVSSIMHCQLAKIVAVCVLMSIYDMWNAYMGQMKCSKGSRVYTTFVYYV